MLHDTRVKNILNHNDGNFKKNVYINEAKRKDYMKYDTHVYILWATTTTTTTCTL